MSLKISYNKATDKTTAYNLIKNNFNQSNLEKFKIQAEIFYDDDLSMITAQGKGFDFKVSFYDDYAEVDLSLGFMFKAFKGKVLSAIEQQITKFI